MTPLDAMPDALFWSLFIVAWFMVSLIGGLAIGKLIRYCDRERNKYVTRDWHTERKCRATRRGFKTRAGIR